MGITSANYPGTNPGPAPSPSVNVTQAIADTKLAINQTSILKARPCMKNVLTDLGSS